MNKMHRPNPATVERVVNALDFDEQAICADCGKELLRWYNIDDDHASWTRWAHQSGKSLVSTCSATSEGRI